MLTDAASSSHQDAPNGHLGVVTRTLLQTPWGRSPCQERSKAATNTST